MWEHRFLHCSQWNDQQKALWKAVAKATGCKMSRCWYVQISELFFFNTSNQSVMSILAATNIRNILPKVPGHPELDEPGQDEWCLN